MPNEPRYREGDKIAGRYLVHEARVGGVGELYLCLDLRENLPFALKTLKARYLTTPKVREYFEYEAATWVKLEKHPNVVRCFYLDKLDSVPFLFLEWVLGTEGVGTDLRDWLVRRGPLEPRRALEFTLDVCRALDHAGRKVAGFVHCDVKPQNVLVAQGQLAKLTDFGLARLVRDTDLVPGKQSASAAGGHRQVSRAPARRRTWRPSSGEATRSMPAPTSTPSGVCSTSCCRASRRFGPIRVRRRWRAT